MSNRTSGVVRAPLRRLCGPSPALHRSSPVKTLSTCAAPSESPTSSTVSADDGMNFVDKSRMEACLEGFKALYDDGLLLDVTLQVDGQQFHCHKALLASSSDYFRAMFTGGMLERSQDTIPINGVEVTSMEQILNYLYTGEAYLKPDTVQSILSAANLFQLSKLRDGCARFMSQHLEADNCIGVHFFAKAHQCDRLARDARTMIEENFDSIVYSSPEFLELSIDNLLEVLSYDDLATSEEEMYEAGMRWLNHDMDNRAHHAYNILHTLRLPLIDEHFFYDNIKNNPLFKSHMELQQLFDEVIKMKLLRSRWIESDLRTEPRQGGLYGSRVCVYTSYTDDEKKQVLQLYGPNSENAASRNGNILCDLPPDIENPALLVTGDNDLYIAGGDAYGRAVYKWLSEDCLFEEMSPMPVARKQFSLVQVDKWLYAVGGHNQEGNLTSVHRISGPDDIWEPVESLPFAVRCCCCIPYHGKLYLFGGESEKVGKKVVRGKKEISKVTLCFDPKEERWSQQADMPTARALAGCMIFRNKIYLIGGFGTITESWMRDKCPEDILMSVDVYDPELNSWEEGPALPVPLCAMGALKFRGTIYVIGGEGIDSVSSDVYALNPTSMQWEAQEEIITGVTETTIHSAYAVLNVDVEDSE